MKPAALALLVGLPVPRHASAQSPRGTVLEETEAPERNYHRSGFKLRLPGDVATAQLGQDKVPNYPTAWLPTARVADRWQWLVTEKP